MALRSDLRTGVRDLLYESTADLITDAQINRALKREIDSLPSKQIFLKKFYTTTTVVDQMDYALPSGTVEVELLERNDGTSDAPVWTEINGFEVYDEAIHLPYRPANADTIRIHIQKKYANPEDDSTTLDLQDERLELVEMGGALRCYRMLMSYFRQSKSWDSTTAPKGVNMGSVQGWYTELKRDYDNMVRVYQDTPLPREIDLTS